MCSRTSSALALALSLGLSSFSLAAPILHGNFVGTNVSFLQVTEDSGTDTPPLFGTPVVSADTLDFNPVSFNSSSAGLFGNDITDGTLTFFVQAKPNKVIDTLTFLEQGDVTLVGFGGLGTFASVSTSIFIDILKVDGFSITPISISGNMTFTPSGGTFNQLQDGGGGPLYQTIWKGTANFDITQALIDAGFSDIFGATLVSVTLDNTLVTLSEQGTQAFIAKKDAKGVTIIVNVPEASTITMMSLMTGVLVVAAWVRRRPVAQECSIN